MASTGAASSAERARLQLEEEMTELRKAIRHWQMWEMEYEGIKEELDKLPDSASSVDMQRVAKDFEGDLVNDAEIRDIFGLQKSLSRSKSQVLGLLSHRVDYVHRNVETLRRQLDEAEHRVQDELNAINADTDNEQTLPLADIQEQLDEEDNVISSTVKTPGESGNELLSTLRKAELEEDDAITGEFAPSTSQEPDKPSRSNGIRSNKSEHAENKATKQHVDPEGSFRTENQNANRKKSVAFADGTKEEAPQGAPIAKPWSSQKFATDSKGESLSAVAKASFRPGERVIELNDYDEPIAETTTTGPVEESPEDEALRRQMLHYSMNEVGHVVAQMDIDELGEEGSDFDAYGSDDAEDSEASSDENEWGMSTRRGLDDDYLKEMLALEQKLDARAVRNIGPQASDAITINENLASSSGSTQRVSPASVVQEASSTRNRGVRFAEELDIAPSSATAPPVETSLTSQPRLSTAIRDTVVERTPELSPSSTVGQTSKVSRFRSARQAQNQELAPSTASAAVGGSVRSSTLDDNTSPPLAETVVERTLVSQDVPIAPSDPRAFDETFQERQLATEYYRERNRLVQKAGGFVKANRDLEAETAEVSGDEDEHGKPKAKVSLFKAARLKKNAE